MTRYDFVSSILFGSKGDRSNDSALFDTLHKLHHILVISNLKRMVGKIVNQLKRNIINMGELGFHSLRVIHE